MLLHSHWQGTSRRCTPPRAAVCGTFALGTLNTAVPAGGCQRLEAVPRGQQMPLHCLQLAGRAGQAPGCAAVAALYSRTPPTAAPRSLQFEKGSSTISQCMTHPLLCRGPCALMYQATHALLRSQHQHMHFMDERSAPCTCVYLTLLLLCLRTLSRHSALPQLLLRCVLSGGPLLGFFGLQIQNQS